MIVSILVFLLILSILILVHEFGHLLAARRVGVRVEEFALGLPFTKRLWGRKIRGVNISLYPILFGGFVRLTGEDDPQAALKDPQNFQNKTPGARLLIAVSGVAMNILLAILVFTLVLSMKGWKEELLAFRQFSFVGATVQAREEVFIVDVLPDSPALHAGIKPGERVMQVEEMEIQTVGDLQTKIASRVGQTTTMRLRGERNVERTVQLIPKEDPETKQGIMGVRIGPLRYYVLDYGGFPRNVMSGVFHSVNVIGYQGAVLGLLISRSFETGDPRVVKDVVVGPVGIGFFVHTLIETGGSKIVLDLLGLVALMSLTLGVVNLFPIPALDGGRAAFIVVELLTGKRNPRIEAAIHGVGMALLFGLIILITANDISRFVPLEDIGQTVRNFFP
ncbi:MAG: M50 family metallopeptidase [bacterium]|nr:M50 family metallopeptidase [bacterium]